MRFFGVCVVLALGLLVAPVEAEVAKGATAARAGALVIDHDRLVAYVADADNAALHRVDLTSLDVVSTSLPCAPEQALLVDAQHVAVTLRGCNQVALVAVDEAGEG